MGQAGLLTFRVVQVLRWPAEVRDCCGWKVERKQESRPSEHRERGRGKAPSMPSQACCSGGDTEGSEHKQASTVGRAVGWTLKKDHGGRPVNEE